MKLMRRFGYICLLLLAACSTKSKTLVSNSGSISAGDILEMIAKGEQVYLDGKTITGTLDLTTLANPATETEKMKRAYINGAITFINCTFLETVTGFATSGDNYTTVSFERGISFINCTMNKELNLREALCYGPVNLKGSKITTLIAEGAKFYSTFTGSYMEVFRDTRLQNAYFNNTVIIMNGKFAGTTSFQGCHFNQDAQLNNITVTGYSDFTNLFSNTGFFVNYGVFNGKFVLNNSNLNNRAEFIGSTFNDETTLNNCSFNGTCKLNKAVVNASFTINNSFFLKEAPDVTGIVAEKGKFSVESTLAGNEPVQIGLP
jgi:hypothetical protein